MSIKAVVVASAIWFKPEGQDEASPAEFKIRPLTQPEYLEVINDHYDPERKRFTAKGIIAAVRYGLLDWRGYLGADSKELRFNRGAINEMPYDVLTDIGIKVIDMTQNTEEERKN